MTRETDSRAMKAQPHTLIGGLGLLLALSIFTARSLAFDFIADDALISLRYLRNLLDGNGLVFNVGDRVEGYSNLLWILLLAGIEGVSGADLLLLSRILGGVFGAGTILLTFFFARALMKPPAEDPKPELLSELPPVLATLAVASHPGFACWSLAGLETVFHTFLLLVATSSVLLAWRGQRPGRLWIPSLFSGLLVLSRPEGILLGAGLAFLAWFGSSPRRFKSGAVQASLFLLFPLGLHLFRYFYYSDFFPNTYYAKSSGGWLRYSQGLDYLFSYTLDHGGALVVPAALLFCGLAKPRMLGLLLAIPSLTQAFFVLHSGGDGLPMYRFLVPAVPLFSLCVALALSRVLRHPRSNRVGRVDPLRVTAIVVALGWIGYSSADPRLASQYSLYRDQKEVQIPAWTAAGKWLAQHAKPGDSIAAVAIGAVAYYSGLTTYDMLGLTDRHIARSEPPEWRKKLNQQQRWAGHEKQDGAYIVSRRPTYLLLGNIAVTETPLDETRPASQFIPYRNTSWIRVWEYDVIHHPDLDRLYRPRVVELPNGQFFNFLELRAKAR